jgi:hypothetical protein
MTFLEAIAAVVILTSNPCGMPEARGCAILEEGRIEIEAGASPAWRKHVLWHERGHLYDYRALDDGERSWIAKQMSWKHFRSEGWADQFAYCRFDQSKYPKVCRFIYRGGLD